MDGIASRVAVLDASEGVAAAPAFDCTIETGLAAIDSLRREWEALAVRSRATAFQSFAFARAAAETLPRGTMSVLAIVRSGARVAAILPLERRRRLGLAIASGLGAPYAQYDDALADPAFPSAVEVAIGHLVDGGVADAVVFRRVREGSPLATALEGRGRVIGQGDVAPHVDLAGVTTQEALTASLSGKKRQNLRRGRAKLAEAGPVTFTVHRGAEAREPATAAIATKRAWLAGTGRLSPALADRRIEALFAAIARTGPDGLAVSVLSVAGAPVAYEIGLVAGRRYHAFLGALDQRVAEASPGSVQMHETLGWCLEQGLEVYDLLPPADAYKARWTRSAIGVRDVALALSPLGAAYVGLWHARMRPALKHGFAAMPAPLRKLLSRMS